LRSAAYHPSSHLLMASRVGSGRSAAVNASRVIVTRRRGVKNHRLESRMSQPRSSIPTTGCSGPWYAHENQLPHSPRVRTSTTVVSGAAASTSDTARAPPSRSTPSRVSRPLGQRSTLSPAFSAAAIRPAASVARWCASALAFSMSGTRIVRMILAMVPSRGSWKLISLATGRT
jgi:hypothetical protein